jgi:hypothetical protein
MIRGGKMAASFSTSGISQVLTFPFKDPKWVGKLLIGMVVGLAGMIIPIVPGIILYGYVYQIMHRIIVEKGDPYLPEWDNWGKFLKDGWRLFCVYFIYLLPSLGLMSVGLLLYIGLFLALPSQANSGSDTTFPIIMLGIMAIFFLCMFVSILFQLVAAILLPPAGCHAVRFDSFTKGFDVAGYWKVFKANSAGFFLALILFFGLFGITYFVSMLFYMTMILCCLMYVVAFIGGFYILLVIPPIFAIAYREGVEKLEAKQVPIS